MRIFRFHPGESVVINFIIPFQRDDVAAVVMSIRDQNHVVFEATATAFGEEHGEKMRVGYTFTQQESLLFDEYSLYWLQLNVFSYNSSRIASDELRVETGAQHLYETSYGSDPEIMYAWEYEPNKGDEQHRAISYTQLEDKPRINNETLIDNRDLPEDRITNDQIDAFAVVPNN